MLWWFFPERVSMQNHVSHVCDVHGVLLYVDFIFLRIIWMVANYESKK